MIDRDLDRQFQCTPLIKGPACHGSTLVLDEPISFWGGVNPKTGAISHPRHPQFGDIISDKILFIPGTIGSSSAAAVMAELIYQDRAPAALVLHEPDAILLLGIFTAQEMNWPSPAAYQLDKEHFASIKYKQATIDGSGLILIKN